MPVSAQGYEGRTLGWFEVDHPNTQAEKRATPERLGIEVSERAQGRAASSPWPTERWLGPGVPAGCWKKKPTTPLSSACTRRRRMLCGPSAPHPRAPAHSRR